MSATTEAEISINLGIHLLDSINLISYCKSFDYDSKTSRSVGYSHIYIHNHEKILG